MRHWEYFAGRMVKRRPRWVYRGQDWFFQEVFRLLMQSKSWRRHAAPFAKTRRGLARRTQRRFILSLKQEIEI